IKTKEHKEYLEKNPAEYLKSIAEYFKGPKESVENPGFGNIGDPAEVIGELRTLTVRLAGLEARLEAFGSAFIKAEDRPQTRKQQR
ncbi:MAG: hypothetical protein WCD38_08280, partial [Candidatus Tumulicola sp.]